MYQELFRQTLSNMKKNQVTGKFKVQHPQGLHAGPSIEIVKCASAFKCEIFFTFQKQSVSAKSLLSILMLTAAKGSQILVTASGDDAASAVHSIVTLAERLR